jgi:hypothetical protein
MSTLNPSKDLKDKVSCLIKKLETAENDQLLVNVLSESKLLSSNIC